MSEACLILIAVGILLIICGIFTYKNPDFEWKYSLSRQLFLKGGEPTESYYTHQRMGAIVSVIFGIAFIIGGVGTLFQGTMKYAVEINGTELKLPCEYSDIEAIGFRIDSDENIKTLSAGKTTSYVVTNPIGQEFEITFENRKEVEQAATDCTVIKLYFRDENSPDVVLSNGVEMGMTEKEVESIMGDPVFGQGYDIEVGTNNYSIAIGYDSPFVNNLNNNMTSGTGLTGGIGDYITYSSATAALNNSQNKKVSFIIVRYEEY